MNVFSITGIKKIAECYGLPAGADHTSEGAAPENDFGGCFTAVSYNNDAIGVYELI